MAIFHFMHSFVRRGNKGYSGSAVANAAYISGQKIEDNEGSTRGSDFSERSDVLHEEITLPNGSPSWASDRGELWRRLEARADQGSRKTQARLAHNFHMALPHELTLEQNIFVAREYVRKNFTDKGFLADWAIHAPDPRGDKRHIHMHLMSPLRRIDGESFGYALRYTKKELRVQMIEWRHSWADVVNRHLPRYVFVSRIDHRSLRAQGIRRAPQRFRGPQPRAKPAVLKALRALQPPLPLKPIVRITKKRADNGAIVVNARISRSALSRIGADQLGSNYPAINVKNLGGSDTGWPPAAIEDWKNWGYDDPFRFFLKWPLLGSLPTMSGPSPQP